MFTNEVIGIYTSQKPSVEYVRGFVSEKAAAEVAPTGTDATAAVAANDTTNATTDDEIEIELGLVVRTQCGEEYVVVSLRKNPVNIFPDSELNPIELGR